MKPSPVNYAPSVEGKNYKYPLYPYVFPVEEDARRWAKVYIKRHSLTGYGGALPTIEPVLLPREENQ